MNESVPLFRAFTRQHVRIAAIIICALNSLFLAGTYAFEEWVDRLPGGWEHASYAMRYILYEFSLAPENVVAVWYSSMLLLAVGVMAALCFFADLRAAATRFQRWFSGGWLVIAVIFSLLSLDEMGSLHEGISSLEFADTGWDWKIVWLLPVALMAIYLLGFGLLRLRRNLKAIILLVAGVLLFLTVPIQEHLEEKFTHPLPGVHATQRPSIDTVIEEGSEVFGMLACFCALGAYLTQATGDGKPVLLPRGTALAYSLGLVGGMVAVLGLIEILYRFVPFGSPGVDGIPRNWLPSAMALISAVLAARLYAVHRVRSYQALALLCVMISAYFGANYDGYLWDGLRGLDVWTLGFHLVLIVASALLATSLYWRSSALWGRWGLVVWAVLLVAALAVGEPQVAILSFVAFTALFLALIAHLLADHHSAAGKIPAEA